MSEQKNYFTGIIGAFLGGLVFTIPWILLYVYANMIYSLLAVLVAIGSLLGYQLFKGKVDKKLPIIITVISLLAITIATLVIIPILLLLKENIIATIPNIKLLYSESSFLSAIMRDYAISIVFTILGISGVIASIKKQINDGEVDKIKIDLSNGNNKKEKEKTKKIFVSHNALDELNMLDQDKLKDINENTLNILINQHIIVKKDDKYYYSINNEKKSHQKNIIVIAVLLLIFIISIFIVINNNDNKNNTDTPNNDLQVSKDISYTIPNTYKEFARKDEENSWYYLPKSDLSGYSGYINLDYFASDISYSITWVENIKTYFETNYEAKTEKTDYFKNSNNIDVAQFNFSIKDYKDIVYYVFYENQIAVIEVIDYGKGNNIQEDAKKLVDSLMWLK
ncbi:MAG: hypothetical protein ACI4VR_01265 [Bacilli bacterium]